MLTVTAKATIPLPTKQINLPKWFYSLTETEFQQASKSNLGMSIETNSDGKHIFNNNVALSGHLLQNHYLEKNTKQNYLYLVSTHSQLFIFKLLPISINVSYELSILPISSTSTEFICTSVGKYPKWLEIISYLTFAKYFLQKHQNEETAYFAKNIKIASVL